MKIEEYMKQKRAESRVRYFVREQARKRGWNVQHLSVGGSCLEEQEIIDCFKDIGLGLERPDFLFCLQGNPILVIETKNEASKIENALQEAIYYSDKINENQKYKIKIAIGVAGEEDTGYVIEVRFLRKDSWVSLKSKGFEITTIPARAEIEAAIEANDGTTNVQVPSVTEFIDSAIELSKILRQAKVEAPLRPKVIGALTVAMYQGTIDISSNNALNSINSLLELAIKESVDLNEQKKCRLIESLKLLGADYERLSPYIGRIVHLMRGLNIRAVLQTDIDFLGLFYEAFLRYGYDNNALGIVFTPRHITKFCVDLVDVGITDMVIDIACGTGGFLVSAFDRMFYQAHGPKAIQKAKASLYGFDTNPTIWALSTLNMFFRGDGKSHIENRSCFEKDSREEVQQKFTRAFLNPPFSQDNEPEHDFIDASMSALMPEGIFVSIVWAGIFADEDNAAWRKEFTRNHTLLGMISMPEDLFYPTAAATTIMIAKSNVPQQKNDKVFMARIWNDGFEKLKGRRITCEGNQLPDVLDAFHKFMTGVTVNGANYITIVSENILTGNEWSPQQWFPQQNISNKELQSFEEDVRMSLFRAITAMPTLADITLNDFTSIWNDLPNLPLSQTKQISYFFEVFNGKSSGEKNYHEGDYPYISSGDTTNSIIRLVDNEKGEIFQDGGITVTAFGQAYIQPWPFMARGNGGSAVRILKPKFRMNLNELIWFAACINSQRWRFFYGRMAIRSRLERLEVSSPRNRLNNNSINIKDKFIEFKKTLYTLSKFTN
ncbi:MAG: N-6 DNA methylase [Prevotellaceae bacterium]|jgi:type I restriction-modification system DNA methylase subunit|nr:N-6 DNA methylase [Prevotellaceae bacterium]